MDLLHPKPKLIFINQPLSNYTRAANTLDKKNHGHIVSVNGSKSFPKIHVKNAVESLMLVVKPCYAEEKETLHQYRLVRYDRKFYKNKSSLRTEVMDPLYYKLNKDNNYTVDLKLVVMAPGDKYQRPGEEKLKKGDPKIKKMVLSCELFSCENEEIGNTLIHKIYSVPFRNSRDKTKLNEIIGEGSIDGGTEINLPNLQNHNNVLYKVRFSKGKWRDYGEKLIIDSKYIWVKSPPYQLKNITEAVTVNVHILNESDGTKSKVFYFKYTPSESIVSNCSPVKTSQNDYIKIKRMISRYTTNGRIEAWLLCNRITLSEEYVKQYIRVRFSRENLQAVDVEIKEFIAENILIIETEFNFDKNNTKNAVVDVQIKNMLYNTLSEKFSHELYTPTNEKNYEFYTSKSVSSIIKLGKDIIDKYKYQNMIPDINNKDTY